MEIIYALEQIPYKLTKSIFLAGPVPRDKETKSWRPDAIQILQDIGFENGTVFNPESRNGEWHGDHKAQIEFEDLALNMADVILFWIPRNLTTLHGLTTNTEWGRWERSGKVVLGYPETAERMNYIDYYARKNNIEPAKTLTETIENALEKLGEGQVRTNGERFVSLNVWNTPSFQKWYRALLKSGNRLESATVEYSFGKKFGGQIFLWALQPSIFVSEENRYKSDEIIVSRPDISSVCMYAHADEDIEVVLVKEFRSACSNENYLFELPSGHTPGEQESAKETAISEVHEECDFDLEEERLKYVGSRQLAGTLSAHKSHLFAYELEKEELDWFRAQKDITHGNTGEGERTYIEVVKLSSILENNLLDWTNVGEIYAATKG